MVYNVHKNEYNDRESRKRNFENAWKCRLLKISKIAVNITMQISQKVLNESKQYLRITLFPT